ncbi:NAD-binding protein [Fomitiporia mediterranea MF3/22]|uniref:NAD-binding protein n=1 Tax=Fomitiporia mediterranea (strain MF3/22) TaxID=694068 RepID=UPI0004408B49|nr:NAD-binding protein [Fomitiporia mediterranea MF3/22]EJD06578.1 NAD-binding protein [Fomitiporia mediterranea MF3/22]
MQSAIDTLKGKHTYDQNDVPNLSGRTALVTGGTQGIGFEVAKTLAVSKARVLLLSRKVENGTAAVEAIQKETSGGADIEFVEIDLGNLKNVCEVADRISAKEARLDILVADAGIGVNKYELSSDGIEHHFSVNNLGHILLINRLLPLIRKSAQLNESPAPRIVQLSSSLHKTAPSSVAFESLEEINDSSLGPNTLYARSKLANILFTRWLVAHVLEDGSRIYALATHPGAVHTEQQNQLKDAYGETVGGAMKAVAVPFMRSPDQGSLSTLWAATDPEVEQKGLHGAYVTDPGTVGGETKQAQNDMLADNLWTLAQGLIKEKAGEDAFLDWTEVKA